MRVHQHRFLIAAAIAVLSLAFAADSYAQRAGGFGGGTFGGGGGGGMTGMQGGGGGPRGGGLDGVFGGRGDTVRERAPGDNDRRGRRRGPRVDGGGIVVTPGGAPQETIVGDGGPSSRRKSGSQRARQNSGGNNSGTPAASERRLVPDEVVVEFAASASPQAIATVLRRYRLTRIESQAFQLPGSTLHRLRIPDRRSVFAVVRALQADRLIAAAQANYLFALAQTAPAPEAGAKASNNAGAKPAGTAQGKTASREGDAAQYALAKLRLPEAHAIAKGDHVLVAVIDSGIDADHPELAGTVVESFDTLKAVFKPHDHGTAIAALIAGHARLMGSAPAARILAIRAFDPAGSTAEATTFNILKGLDWAAENHARIINMSFAGPSDPAIHRSLEAAHKRGIVLVAAAGNAGPKSPPLYPAADAGVIAVTATDAEDKLFGGSNRGSHIAVAAPGVDILVAIPGGGYHVSSGTSYSAAEVSGIVALMLQRNPALTPDAVLAILRATARDLGPKGRDEDFGSGLTDAYRAVTEDAPDPRVSNATAPR